MIQNRLLATAVLSLTLLVSCQQTANESVEADEPRWKHLSTATGELPPLPAGWRDQTACVTLDIDRDGRDDFVVSDRNAKPSVFWYRPTDDGWKRYVIDSEAVKIGAGGTAGDIDGDGDEDIVLGGRFDSNEIWWWENPYPNYDPDIPWKRRALKRSGERGHHDQILGDFDADSRTELIAWNQRARQLLYFEMPQEPRSDEEWTYHTIFRYEGDSSHEGLAKADINQDGKLDVIGGGYWFEHRGGVRFEAHLIDEAMHFTRAAAGQFKKGGWAEVVFCPGDADGPLKWYEWDGERWIGRVLLDHVTHGHSIDTGDVDLDGNLDLFVAEMGQWSNQAIDNPQSKAWIFYGDGAGGFRTEVVSQGIANHESKLGDFNNDGFLDIVSKPFRARAPRVDVLLQQRPGIEETKTAIAEGGAERINTAVDRLTAASHNLAEAMYRASGAEPGRNSQSGSKPKDDVVDAATPWHVSKRNTPDCPVSAGTQPPSSTEFQKVSLVSHRVADTGL